MNERLRDEIERLRQKYPQLQHGERGEWVGIPDYPLPPGVLNRETTKLLFIVPTAYPTTGPDDFFVDANLRRRDGSPPPGLTAGSNSSSGTAPVAGEWAWFSWHPVAWRPKAKIEDGDNLLTFLRGVNLCLAGIETT